MNHALSNRLTSLKICAGAAFIIGALLYGPVMDEADNEAARDHEQAQELHNVDWIDLEKIADAMTIIGRKKLI